MSDFFISYTRADRSWAEWVAWQLEEAGYAVLLQSWDFGPGSNFILKMQQAATESERTIAILSNDYFRSEFARSEWAAAFAQDPDGKKGVLIPVRVEECRPPGLLASIVYIDLVDKDEEQARELLLASVRRVRAKPAQAPPFPGKAREPKPYPGTDAGERRGGVKKLLRQSLNRWIDRVRNRLSPEINPAKARREMLEKVRSIWIEGVRKSMEAPVGASLKVRIRLGQGSGVTLKASAGTTPQSRVKQDVCSIFDDADHLLLILGEPGTGKTFKLLELLEGLLTRAEQDPEVPIPVVFKLSSWAEWSGSKKSMREWLISELVSVYDISQTLAEYWLDGQELAFLLDGLDEITAVRAEPGREGEESTRRLSESCRRRCLNEINNYILWSDIWLALCCRKDEYSALGTELYTRRDDSTAFVQPLTDAEVKDYLKKAGPALKSLREAVSKNETLRQMARTPFLLRTMSIVYREKPGLSAKVIIEGGKGSEKSRWRELFDKYVHERHRGAQARLRKRYPLDKVRDYLGEMADKMERGDSKLFLVDQLQPSPVWLSPSERWLYRLLVAVFLLLFVWVLICLPAGWALGYERATSAVVLGSPTPPLGEALWHFDVSGMFKVLLSCGGIVAAGFMLFKGRGFGAACGLAFGVARALIVRRGQGTETINWLAQGALSLVLGIALIALLMHLRDHDRDKICPIERSKLSLRRALIGAGTAASLGGILGVALSLILGVGEGLHRGLAFGFALIPVCVLFYGYRTTSVEVKTRPNQGIRNSAHTALWTLLWSALTGVLCFGGFYWWLSPTQQQQRGVVNAILGLALGTTSLVFGGIPLMQHYGLRMVLFLRGLAPLGLVRFLKAAEAMHLLRRVGGGYEFQHEYLREYFLEYHRATAK